MPKRLLAALLHWLEDADVRALELYLAKSANPADLERRMREWEARHNRTFNAL